MDERASRVGNPQTVPRRSRLRFAVATAVYLLLAAGLAALVRLETTALRSQAAGPILKADNLSIPGAETCLLTDETLRCELASVGRLTATVTEHGRPTFAAWALRFGSPLDEGEEAVAGDLAPNADSFVVQEDELAFQNHGFVDRWFAARYGQYVIEVRLFAVPNPRPADRSLEAAAFEAMVRALDDRADAAWRR